VEVGGCWVGADVGLGRMLGWGGWGVGCMLRCAVTCASNASITWKRAASRRGPASSSHRLTTVVLLGDEKEYSESRSGNDCRNPIVRIESVGR